MQIEIKTKIQELIEECGNNFSYLFRYEDGSYRAFQGYRGKKNISANGDTPENAIANLIRKCQNEPIL